MESIIRDFTGAHSPSSLSGDVQPGYLLASTISPEPPANEPARFYQFMRSSSKHNITTDLTFRLKMNRELGLDHSTADAWIEVYAMFYKFVGALLGAEELQNAGRTKEADWTAVYDGWKDVVNALYKGYQATLFHAWTLPCLYVAGKYLRVFAIKADDQIASQRDSGLAFGGIQEEDAFNPDSRNDKLEDAARQINRIFGLCISDRSPLAESRKWALYYTANLLFKTYFKLNSLSLCKNIIRSIRASSADMPALEVFPKSHRVTFHYYLGVIHFLEEDYTTAEENLETAYNLTLSPSNNTPNGPARGNVELILTYLIPTKLLTTHRLPSHTLLAPFPRLVSLFQPITEAIRSANLSAFNAALEAGESEFVKRRIYLTLERGRDIILRNLFRKVFLAGGYEPSAKEGEGEVRRTRVPMKEFAAALVMAGADIRGEGEGGVDVEEVECLVANAIYKNLMKGYIARERGIVVLSKAGAFPGTGA